uniref:Uncharacterized protein n=1 Tax=Knipowitschia caucasica TaxID=637954 RepID=A0AAV2MIA3_KNICA
MPKMEAVCVNLSCNMRSRERRELRGAAVVCEQRARFPRCHSIQAPTHTRVHVIQAPSPLRVAIIKAPFPPRARIIQAPCRAHASLTRLFLHMLTRLHTTG